MTPDEEKSKMDRREREGSSFVVAAVLIALFVAVAGTGLYMYYGPSGIHMASGTCAERFQSMDALEKNGSLEYGEVLAYGRILSSETFAGADQNGDSLLSVDEFCAWDARTTG